MSGKRSWVIGADKSCDIVVEQPTVSGRHCRVSLTESRYSVEDLGSTNGTFVNGERLQRPREVSVDDHITLGATVNLPWSQISSPCIVRIGRSADNDVVLDDPSVSAHHAKVTIDGSQATIEDLGSTNGTAVGSSQNRIESSPLEEGDIVYLGSLEIPARQLLGLAEDEELQLDRTAMVGPISGSHASTFLARHSHLLSAALATTAVLIVGALWYSSRAANETPKANGTPGTRNETISTVASSSHSLDRDIATSGAEPRASVQQVATTKPPDPMSALFAVALCDVDRVEFYSLGVAWAVSAEHLVTSAKVAMAIERLREDYPIALAVSNALEQPVGITRARTHPEYEKAYADIASIGDRIEEQTRLLQQADPSNDEFAVLQKAVHDLHEHRFQAVERLACYDIGILYLRGKVPTELEVSRVLPAHEVTLLGFRFDADDVSFDPAATLRPAQLAGKYREALRSDLEQKNSAARYVIGCSSDHTLMRWSGGPVLSKGKVVAMYSRPTPAEDPREPPPGDSYDAVVMQRLYELAPELVGR